MKLNKYEQGELFIDELVEHSKKLAKKVKKETPKLRKEYLNREGILISWSSTELKGLARTDDGSVWYIDRSSVFPGAAMVLEEPIKFHSSKRLPFTA